VFVISDMQGLALCGLYPSKHATLRHIASQMSATHSQGLVDNEGANCELYYIMPRGNAATDIFTRFELKLDMLRATQIFRPCTHNLLFT
jgi:hypothetical protein